MKNLSKYQQHKALINQFKNDTLIQPLLNPHQISIPFSDEVLNPWSLWHGNLNAEILLIGQDFSDVTYFKENFANYWENERESDTNRNLRKLFLNLGYDIGLPNPLIHSKHRYLPLYFTNAT